MIIDVHALQTIDTLKHHPASGSSEDRAFRDALETEVRGEREQDNNSNATEEVLETKETYETYAYAYEIPLIIPEETILKDNEEELILEIANILEEEVSVIEEVLVSYGFTYENLKEDKKAVSEFVKAVYDKETNYDLLNLDGIEKKFENLNEVMAKYNYEKPVEIISVLEEESILVEDFEIDEQIILKGEVQNIEVSSKGLITQSEVSSAEIIDQIQLAIKTVIKSGASTEMTMVLAPEQLGELTLKLTTRDGIVSAAFVVESEKIKEIIEKNLKELAETLELQGIEISDLEVFVKQENSQQMEAFLRESQKSKVRVNQIIDSILEETSENVVKEDGLLVDELV